MNTAACNVKDINTPHITECLSLSFAASFEGCFCLFRTWSFTLCKNDLDPNDVSDSASAEFFILIFCNNETVRVLCGYNKFPRSIIHQFIRCPLLRRPFFVNIPLWVAWWVSVPQQVSPFLDAAHSFHELRGIWLSCLVFTGLCDAVEGRTSGVLSLHRNTKFIIGFDFAVTLSSPESFCVLFEITSEQSVELKWLMLNKHTRWFHSSRVKFLLVSMSARWVFGVNIFDLDFWVQIDSVE